MRIGTRIFPYPILNRNTSLSDYDSINFKLDVDFNKNGELIQDDNSIILKNIKIDTNSDFLIQLFNRGQVKFCCIVSCSSTVYRETFDIDLIAKDISLSIDDFKGNVDVSAFAYVVEPQLMYKSDEFKDFFSNQNIKLRKNNIIAADDGFTFNIIIDEAKDNRVDSIFTIAFSTDGDELLTYEDEGKRITIYLGTEAYKNYNALKNTRYTQNLLFSTILVPVLSDSLNNIKLNSRDVDIEELYVEKEWLYSVAKRYNKIKRRELTMEGLYETNSLQLAQELINYPIINGLNELDNILNNIESDEE